MISADNLCKLFGPRSVASFIKLAARVAVVVAEGGKLARYKTALEQIALGKMASTSW